MATKTIGRFVRPAANVVPEGAKPKDITVKEGDVINFILPSGTQIQLVATKDNTSLKHGERETLFHEQMSEGEFHCTWPPMPEEVAAAMGQMFSDDDGSDDSGSEEQLESLEKALAGK